MHQTKSTPVALACSNVSVPHQTHRINKKIKAKKKVGLRQTKIFHNVRASALRARVIESIASMEDVWATSSTPFAPRYSLPRNSILPSISDGLFKLSMHAMKAVGTAKSTPLVPGSSFLAPKKQLKFPLLESLLLVQQTLLSLLVRKTWAHYLLVSAFSLGLANIPPRCGQ